MKISQHNWNWWFVLSCIGVVIAMLLTFIAADQPTKELIDEMYVQAAIVWIISGCSMLPCLYIGTKPSEGD